jgi:hypothetical protein
MPDVRGAFPNIDRRTMTAGHYEGATAEKAVPILLLYTSTKGYESGRSDRAGTDQGLTNGLHRR